MNKTDEMVRALRDMLERSPGATEAAVRSELRSQFGNSSAADKALADGTIERRGAKLYALNAAARSRR